MRGGGGGWRRRLEAAAVRCRVHPGRPQFSCTHRHRALQRDANALRHGASPVVRWTCTALEVRAASGLPARLLCLQA